MFSGKTTELLRRCNKHSIAGKRVMRVKFTADRRYGNDFTISTHGGHKEPATPVEILKNLNNEWKSYDVIGIDEGQFFTDIESFAEKAAAKYDKIVIIASLQGTFLRSPFPNI